MTGEHDLTDLAVKLGKKFDRETWAKLIIAATPIIKGVADGMRQEKTIVEPNDLIQIGYELLPKLCRTYDREKSGFATYLRTVLKPRFAGAITEAMAVAHKPRDAKNSKGEKDETPVLRYEASAEINTDWESDEYDPISALPDERDSAEGPVLEIFIDQILNKIPPESYALLQLHAVEELTNAEISKALNIPKRDVTHRVQKMTRDIHAQFGIRVFN